MIRTSTSTFAVLLILLFASAEAFSQFEKNYSPIRSSGTLPPEFLTSARQNAEEELKTIGYGQDRSDKSRFVIETNYFLNELLLGGDVLVNDPLTAYVNKVTDELLRDKPEVRKQLHIFVTESPYVNAYAYDKGYIFVNLGLLAQLENEAQLAYVLSHEITHVIRKHSTEQFLEFRRMDQSGSYERGSEEMRHLAKCRFSKDNETAADLEGLNMMKESRYSIKALSGAFDVMQYSYLPFELVEFQKSFFEDEYLIIPDTFFLKKTSEIKANDEYDDSKSTHPNIKKRRASIEADLKVSDEASRQKYLVSEEEFKKTRELSRFEMCRLYLLERDYVNAIYSAFILLQKYPENVYLKKTVAKALYSIQINKSGGSRNKKDYKSGSSSVSLSTKSYSIPDYQEIEGPSQRLYYMLDNLSSKELNTVALAYTYKSHKANPDDEILSALTDSLFSELVHVNNLYLSDFSTQTKAEILAQDTAKAVAVVEEEQEVSKYSTIKKQQQKIEIETDENFIKYAFVGLLKDKEFQKRYRDISKGATKANAQEKKLSPDELKKKRKEEELAAKNSKYLGIEKVIFLDPFYKKIDYVKGNEVVDYYVSEEKKEKLMDIQKKCADRLKLQYEVLNNNNITANDIDRYNDNSALNDWLTERFNFGDNPDALVVSTDDITKLTAKYGSKYIAWSGIYSYNKKKTTYFFIVFNLESGELMKFDTRYVRAKPNTDLVTSFVYSSMANLVKKSK